MERRLFLQQAGTALALALAPAVSGCATLGGTDFSASARQNAHRVALVDRLRERIAAIVRTDDLPQLSEWSASRGFDPKLIGRTMATLWLSSTFRDLPGAIRRSPEIQTWIKGEIPGITETMFELGDMMEGLDGEERERFTEALREVDDLDDSLMRGFEAHSNDRDVERERVAQFNELMTHNAWRVRTQSLGAVIDDYLARMDKVCRRRGVSREGWRETLEAETAVWNALGGPTESEALALERANQMELDSDALDEVAMGGMHLGISMRARSKRDGVMVVDVHPGSPAALAGIARGDIIERIDGQAVDPTSLVVWLSSRSPDQSVALEILRRRESLDLEVHPNEGPGDRIILRGTMPTGVRHQLGLLAAGSTMAGVGFVIAGAAALVFVVGLLLLIAGAPEAGAVMTIFGALGIALGLIIALVGLVIGYTKERQGKRGLRMPAPAP